jgi:ribosomal protein S14
MAKTSIVIRETRRKYPTRVRNRCKVCGRARGYYRLWFVQDLPA